MTLLQELRRDRRTALLCVGIAARERFSAQAERLAQPDAMSKAFAWPRDDAAVRWQCEQLTAIASRDFVDLATRQQQAAETLDLSAELLRSAGKSYLYDMRRVQQGALAALYHPKSAVKATDVLAEMNSAEGQKALVDVASRNTMPLELRTAAAIAFRKNTQKYGIALTTEQIREQYRRYNESEKQDKATQHVLGLVLDCIEAPTKKQHPAK
jgi:hypothetical protein